MSLKKLSHLAIAAGLAGVSAMAQATVTFGAGLNDIELISRENNYRASTACTPATCLAGGSFVGTNGVTYQLVNPAIGDNVLVGDIFIGVFASRTVTAGGNTLWNEDNIQAGGVDTFTGYFAQQVKDITTAGGSSERIILGSVTGGDPMGILAAGQIARAYVDTTTAYKLDGSISTPLTLAQSIASVTDGTVWASFTVGADITGFGVDTDGYMTSELDISTPGNNLTNGTFYTAWEIAAYGPAYNAGVLLDINDPDENVKGGAQLGDPILTSAQNEAGFCPASATYACNAIVGNGQLNFNEKASVSPWLFAGQDPLQLFAVPEPGSLALVGLAVAAMGFAARRRHAA